MITVNDSPHWCRSPVIEPQLLRSVTKMLQTWTPSVCYLHSLCPKSAVTNPDLKPGLYKVNQDPEIKGPYQAPMRVTSHTMLSTFKQPSIQARLPITSPITPIRVLGQSWLLTSFHVTCSPCTSLGEHVGLYKQDIVLIARSERSPKLTWKYTKGPCRSYVSFGEEDHMGSILVWRQVGFGSQGLKPWVQNAALPK